jgi:hypothetical protein
MRRIQGPPLRDRPPRTATTQWHHNTTQGTVACVRALLRRKRDPGERMRAVRYSALACALLFGVAGCGSDDERGGGSPTSEQSTASSDSPKPSAYNTTSTRGTTGTLGTTTSTTTRPTGSLQPGALPPGVPEQFDYFNVGDGPCAEFSIDDGPAVATSFPTSHILTEALICLPGFDPELPTDVTVTAPDGAQTSRIAPEQGAYDDPPTVYQGIPYLLFLLELYAPTGTYEITAQQGAIVQYASFEAAQPPVALLRVRPPTNGSPGDSFTVELAGFASGSPAIVDVYTGDGTFTYVTSLSSAPTDAEGRAELVVSTTPADPGGIYCFVVRGADAPSCGTGSVVKLG